MVSTPSMSKPIEAEGKLYTDVLAGFANGTLGVDVGTEARQLCQRLADIAVSHPRISRVVRHVIEARYEAATGIDPGSVDWQTVIQWFVENMPQILKIILSLLALFGL